MHTNAASGKPPRVAWLIDYGMTRRPQDKIRVRVLLRAHTDVLGAELGTA